MTASSGSNGTEKLPDRVLVYARVKPASPSGSREVATRCVEHDAEEDSERTVFADVLERDRARWNVSCI